MHPDVAKALARLLQRDHINGRDDFIFVGENGAPPDGSAVRRRYVAAACRPLAVGAAVLKARPGAPPRRRGPGSAGNAPWS
jgi:hypothetical protein